MWFLNPRKDTASVTTTGWVLDITLNPPKKVHGVNALGVGRVRLGGILCPQALNGLP